MELGKQDHDANAIAARWLRCWREEAGRTTAEASAGMGVPVERIVAYEDGATEIGVAELIVLAGWYGADLKPMFDEIGALPGLGLRRRTMYPGHRR